MTQRYSKSTARIEFEISVREIEVAIRVVAPPRRVDPTTQNYLLGAAILFLSAKLENYVSDLFKGICQEACRNIKSASGVPESLLGWAFLNDGHFDRSRKYVARNDEGEFIRTTGDYLAKQLLGNGHEYLTPSRFTDIDDKCYPSVKNLKRMFRRIGIDAIFTLVSKRLRCNAENEVSSLNSIRGALAHSGLSGNYSYNDIKVQILRVRRLVAALDKESFYHLRRAGAVAAWKS